MKKLNNKGFTLIELLAVIVIMAILLIVAIPAVARTIENTRRDTFATVAGTYLNAVRNAVIADELKCGTGDTSISAVGDGTYYYAINSADSSGQDLMESGGKSSWGNAEVNGYVKWVKSGKKITYSVILVDSADHGMDAEVGESGLGRSAVQSKTTATHDSSVYQAPSSGTSCTLK